MTKHWLLKYHLRHHAGIAEPTDAQVQDYGLFLIDKLLSQTGKRLQDWACMPHIEGNWEEVFGNWLIMEQREYHSPGLAQEAAECIATFNQDRSAAFERITSAVSNGLGRSSSCMGLEAQGRHMFTTPSVMSGRLA